MVEIDHLFFARWSDHADLVSAKDASKEARGSGGLLLGGCTGDGRLLFGDDCHDRCRHLMPINDRQCATSRARLILACVLPQQGQALEEGEDVFWCGSTSRSNGAG